MKHRLTLMHLIFITFGLNLFFSPPIHSEPPNLSLLEKVVIDYHDSGLYQEELSNKMKQAQEFIMQQALLNKKTKHHKQLALILDIDETSISNYDKMVKRDFRGSKQQIKKEILEANSPAIKPTLDLYRKALRDGIKVFFVTGRSESERAATEKNLIAAGYSNWTGLYLRPNQYDLQTIMPYKTKTRAMISKQGYTIIASIGDQYSDIRGGYALKGFKLPNPYYYLP